VLAHAARVANRAQIIPICPPRSARPRRQCALTRPGPGYVP
jgi:hypothetical protein